MSAIESRRRLIAAVPAFCIGALLSLGNADAAGVLHPDDTLVLRSAVSPNPPDGTGEDCFRYLLGVCQTDRTGDRVGARTAGALPFERGKATVSTYYDFDVDDSDGKYDTVLNAQISGIGEFNGFLALVAGGKVEGNLNVTLLDLGPTDLAHAGNPQVVVQRSLANHELHGTVTTGINFGITVEGGAPYIGAGASPELKFNVKLQKEVIRDGIDFGLQALVRRGHSYRILFDLTSVAKRGATTGAAISQFKLGGPVTDILDTENWLNGVRETILAKLPDLKPESMRIKEGLGWLRNKRMIEPEVVDADGNSSTLSGTAQYLRDRAAKQGLPTSFADIVEKRFRQRIPDAVEEGIDRPGFRLEQLSVMLEPDVVEITDGQTERLNEVIRLLLTPQGQRSSNFIDCDSPGNSGGANGNGNNHGGDCDFPSAGNGSSATSPSAQSGSAADAPVASVAATAPSGGTGAGAFSWAGLAGLLALVAGPGRWRAGR